MTAKFTWIFPKKLVVRTSVLKIKVEEGLAFLTTNLWIEEV